MPIYEYHCKNCNNDFELLQSIKADSVAECPNCLKKANRKVSLSGGLVFKGSGFYINDYKNSGSKTSSSISNSKNMKSHENKGTDSSKPKEESKTADSPKPKQESKTDNVKKPKVDSGKTKTT
jgi:putative FmdB family regulatory protein